MSPILNGKNYDGSMFAGYGHLSQFPSPVFDDMLAEITNRLGAAVPALLATSTTSATIGTGTVNITIQPGLNLSAGVPISMVASTSVGSTMRGTVASYNSGTGALSVTVTAVTGGGTYASWILSSGSSVPMLPLSLVAVGGGANTVPMLDSSGQLGVGVPPTVQLDVKALTPINGIVSRLLVGGSFGAQQQYSQPGVADWSIGQPAGINAFSIWRDRTPGASGTEIVRWDANGNMQVMVTGKSCHALKKILGVSFGGIFNYDSDNGTTMVLGGGTDVVAVNVAANAAVYFGKASTSGRSINVTGTVNTSGTDYAEYMRKSLDCGTIAKGGICGVNALGQLTTIFDESITFLVKSTNPSYVGGDSWGDDPSIGPRPTEPQRKMPVIETTASSVLGMDGQPTVTAIITDPGDTDVEWEARQAQYQKDLATWEEALEAERVKYDRIAFAGQVPCNVTGAKPGDYILPVRTESGGIAGTSKASAEMTMAEYMSAVGKVETILPDGRAKILVKVT